MIGNVHQRSIAVATKVRTLGSKGVWGLRPQPGVPPLHPVLTNPSMAILAILTGIQSNRITGSDFVTV